MKRDDVVLSLDHLGDLTLLVAHYPAIGRVLGFKKPLRANTMGDLERWGFVKRDHGVAGMSYKALTPRGQRLLKSIAACLNRCSLRSYTCPGCKKKKRSPGDEPSPWCECHVPPFRMVEDKITETVEKMIGKRKR